MPFKHYIQKLEGRLPEYAANVGIREWRCTRGQYNGLYFSSTRDVLSEFVHSSTPSRRWINSFSWHYAGEILENNLGYRPLNPARFGDRPFSQLEPVYQDFIMTVLNREFIIDG